jgi:signal transduction histidine kinase
VRRFIAKLVPRRIGSQIALLIVVSLVIAQVVTTAVFLLQAPTRPYILKATLAQIAFTARLLDHAPNDAARAEVLRVAQRSFPELSALQDAPLSSSVMRDERLTRPLQDELGGRFSVLALRPSDNSHDTPPRVAVRLPRGGVIALTLPPPPNRTPFLIGTVMFLAVALTLLFLWAARVLTAPLARFADAAERFSLDRSDASLTENGPIEIRRLARALNDMRERVRALVDDRTRTLASISHDLRTPITRLRLHAEEIQPTQLQIQVIRDLDTMRDMLQSALSFLRARNAVRNEYIRVDLPSIIQALCDDFADMGRICEFHGPFHLYIDCDPDQIGRAVSNLIDNGLKFGTAVSVRLIECSEEAWIEVSDDGPGIPATEWSKVTEPFYRGDTARALGDSGSFGLGLSIACSVMEAHQGRLEFEDADRCGLLARLVLPKDLRQKIGSSC